MIESSQYYITLRYQIENKDCHWHWLLICLMFVKGTTRQLFKPRLRLWLCHHPTPLSNFNKSCIKSVSKKKKKMAEPKPVPYSMGCLKGLSWACDLLLKNFSQHDLWHTELSHHCDLWHTDLSHHCWAIASTAADPCFQGHSEDRPHLVLKREHYVYKARMVVNK